jgi:hypothetical protein
MTIFEKYENGTSFFLIFSIYKLQGPE